MHPNEGTITELLKRICQAVSPNKVILFGSAARGLMAPDSDIDVLVVVSDGLHRRHTSQKIHRALLGFETSVDVLVATVSDLEAHEKNSGLIYKTILAEGKILYAA